MITLSIVAFWLASLGWFAYREWLPWLWADSPPPFTVELADEAVPLAARWSIWRGEQRIGSLTTRLTVQKDDTVELYSAIENLELSMPMGAIAMTIKVPKLTTVQQVTRGGQLRAITTRMQAGLNIPGLTFDMKASLDGTVIDGQLQARCRIESPLFPDWEQAIDPVPLEADSALNPLQPVAKLQVWPGQRWRTSSVDPLRLAVEAALRKTTVGAILGGKLGGGAPKLNVEVLSEPQTLVHQETSVSCYVIESRSGDFNGRTWVRVQDGKVLRQEVWQGEALTLLRED